MHNSTIRDGVISCLRWLTVVAALLITWQYQRKLLERVEALELGAAAAAYERANFCAPCERGERDGGGE